MAFTSAQKESIRLYLGFPGAFHDLNSRLEGAMITVGNDADASATVVTLLTAIATVEAAIASTGSSSSTQGALKAIVGDVEWYDITDGSSSSSTVSARQYGNMLINRLAARFGFTRDELPSDYFGTGGGRGGAMALG